MFGLSLALCFSSSVSGQANVSFSEVGLGWSKNSINATIFRRNSVVSTRNYQFVAYYDSSATVVIARRKHGTDQWEIHRTQYRGNVNDAHNDISIMADGDGYLHLSWDHHNNLLHYSRSLDPEDFEMGPMESMIGTEENAVSYPEFYRLPDGGLLFAYRDGGSGNGNMVLNRYDLKNRRWVRLQNNLIDGEGLRNAYWQLCVDVRGTIHVSWVWRETPDVHSNHDLCYARSEDGGFTWENSRGVLYKLPIKAESAEIICPIPQGSNLINQTSMVVDSAGNPYIATYYKLAEDSCTQFRVIFCERGNWRSVVATHRTLDFELGGVGSRNIPVSRPQLLIRESKGEKTMVLIYRDEEVGNQVILSAANVCYPEQWRSEMISPYPVDRWEPSYDTERWRRDQQLDIYFQKVGQGQGETTVEMEPQMVGILEVR